MMRSVKPPHDAHDAHLKRLLDQRANKSDLHAHPSSPSQYTDTSSIYSASVFSPHPQRKHSHSKSPTSPRETLNDPASSVLDLDDDGQSSYDSSNPDDLDESLESRLDDNVNDDDGGETQLRMSMLGPKMRFHSRAPWETGEDTLEEEDESDNSANPVRAATPSKLSKIRTPKAGVTKMGFSLTSSKPRSVSAGRPSNESARSAPKSKRSFDTVASSISNPSGPVSLRHQGSVPLSPNLSSPCAPSHPMNRNKYIGTHGRPTTPSMVSTTSNTPSPNPSPSTEEFRYSTASPVPWVSADARATFVASSLSSLPQEDNMHPYANPDLVITYSETSPEPQAEQPFPTVSRSDSTITVTHTLAASSTRSATVPADTSMSSNKERSPRARASTFQGKEISLPISFHKPPLHVAEGSANPWNREPKLSLPPHLDANSLGLPNSVVPTFTLISLEEARAQRSRSATTNASSSHSPSSVDFPSRVAPFPEPGGKGPGRPLSVLTTSPFRARSTSAGARAKATLHPMAGSPASAVEGGDAASLSRQSSPSGSVGVQGKGLKHRKSGFLRMFNAREKDKEKEKEIPPPVPQLSDSYVDRRHRSPVRKMSDHTADRIPGPQTRQAPIVPPSPSPDTVFSDTLRDGDLEPYSTATTRQPSVSPRRPPPSLSINVSSPTPTARAPLSAIPSGSAHSNRMDPPSRPGSGNNVPQSAPANVLDFPALKLRPVSTMFSAHFRDHIVGTDSDADLDSRSPTSSGHGTIPVTPATSAPSDPTNISKSGADSNDPMAVIQSLQNQIALNKKAWQLEVWDLEGQVRDLKAEIEELRATEQDYCETCGRGKRALDQDSKKSSIVHRPRARVGNSSRFGNGK